MSSPINSRRGGNATFLIRSHVPGLDAGATRGALNIKWHELTYDMDFEQLSECFYCMSMPIIGR